jgi:dipeptidyl aminopeptidase/acylaminoacyl peptidase
MIDLDDGAQRRFTAEGVSSSSPQFSPDGRTLAFLTTRRDRHEARQIYLIPVDGGEAQMLTEHETGVGSFVFSPDGSRIAFIARDAKTEEQTNADQEGRDWHIVDETLTYRRVWVIDLDTRAAKPLYEGDLEALDMEWMPNGEHLIMRLAPRPGPDSSMMESDLYRISADGGEPEKLFDTDGKLGDFEVAPDGSRIAFLGAVDIYDPLAQSIFVAPLDGSADPRNMTSGAEVSFYQIEWLDRARLLVRSNERQESAISIMDASFGARRLLFKLPAIYTMELDPGTGRFVVVSEGHVYPGELFVGSINSSDPRRLTNSNPQLDEYAIARVDEIAYEARDGERIEGVLTYPIGHEDGQRYPLAVNPHGGPEGANKIGFNSIAQLLAARGYVVFQPNYRGSAARGVVWTKGDHGDLGGAEFDDVLDGIDVLIERGLVDSERVGIGGWSYGGYFSALGATHHSDRFKAAVMGAGIANWISFTGTSDIPIENTYVHWDILIL